MTQSSQPAKEALRIILPIVILAVAGGAFFTLHSLKESPAAASPEASITTVETVQVVEHKGDIKIAVTGEVVSFREVNVAAEVAGRVASKKEICESGTFVRQGDVLLEIDDEDYKLEQRRLAKELEQSRAYLKELAAEIEGALERLQVAGQEVASAEAEYRRQQNLRGVVSDSQIDRAKREYLAARNAEIQIKNQHQLLESRKLRLTSAAELVEVQLERAALDIARATVKSPVTGVITSEQVQQDDYVQKGETLLTIEDTSKAEITCQMTTFEEQWIWLSHPDLLAKRNLADDPSRDYELPKTRAKVICKRGNVRYQWDGYLTRYDGLGFDPVTRTIPCRVLVENPREETVVDQSRTPGTATGVIQPQLQVGPQALVPGMYVRVELYTRPQVPLFQVPIEAVQPGNSIWKVVSIQQSDGKSKTVLKEQMVEVLDQINVPATHGKRTLAVVYSRDNSLRPVDLVVVSPLSAPRDGMPVQLEGTSE